MSKKWLLLFAGLVLCSTLSGCWSKVEINERSFITGLFVDLTDKPGEVELTIVTPLPNRFDNTGQSGNRSDPTSFGIISEKAVSLPEAFRKIQATLTRKLTWGQTKVIVLGRKYAEKGMDDLLEWLVREQSFHLKAFVFVAKGNAKDLTNLAPVYEQSPSEVLRQFANNRTLLDKSLKDVLQSLHARQGMAVTQITIGYKTMHGEVGQRAYWAKPEGAVMLQAGKMVGTLHESDARGISWIYGSLKDPQYTLKLQDGSYTFILYQPKNKIRPIIQKEKVVFRITMTAEAGLESADTPVDITDPKKLQRAEAGLNQKITSNLRSALEKSQTVKADVLQLGSYLEWWYPEFWKGIRANWPDYYKENVHFEIQTQIKVVHYNGELKPIWNLK